MKEMERTTEPGPPTLPNSDYSIGAMIRPVPSGNKLQLDDYYVWCGSVAKGDDGNYHMFYSRWQRKDHFYAWVSK
jgi:hypothetical protein